MLRFGKNSVIPVLFITYILSFPRQALSAEERPGDTYRQKLEAIISEEPKAEEKLPFESSTYMRYMPVVDAGSDSGKVGIIESANECSYELKAFEKMPLEFSFNTEYISINNSAQVHMPSHLTGFSFGAEATVPFFNLDKTYFRLGVYPAFYAENWNVRSSAFRMPVHTFLIYQPSDKWTFICGVGTYPDYETKVVPIFGFIYKPNEKLIFNIIPSNPNISYSVNDKLTLFLEAGMMDNEYEVEKEGVKKAILQYVNLRAGAGLSYKINKHIEANVSCGGVFNRRLQYRDSLGKINLDNGMYSEFRLDMAI